MQKAQNKFENDKKSIISKKAKIIVRNLPFKNLSEKSLEKIFKEYGNIEEVKLLKKEDGKFVGCGFVQFKKVSSAAKAVYHGNLKEIYGRKIIVDWALPKNTFIKKAQKVQNEFSFAKIKSEVLSDDEKFTINKNPDSWSSDEKSDIYKKEDEVSDDEDEIKYENEDDNKNFKHKNAIKTRSNDVEDGKTVFLRNIPFSATNDDLKQCIQSYGCIDYAVICIDKLTEHSKGTAFVKFKDKESASRCIQDSRKIYLHENPLTATLAISKENLEVKKKSKNRDSRNLYLVREGVVVAGSKAAIGISASDMAKRLQMEQWKTQILKNLNMFVSKTRLVVHNLPLSYDDAKLKQLFLKHSNPKAVVKEAKVMHYKKKLDAKGNRISKEVGFISFLTHEDALTALRNINNNPNIFTPTRRPIVSFSIENKAILNAKQKNLEKSKAKSGTLKDNNFNKLSKLNRKQRRFIKRRQNIIEKRRNAKKAKNDALLGLEVKIENKVISKRKKKFAEDSAPSKKQKTNKSEAMKTESNLGVFTGIISEPGKKIKLRSILKLKNQANIHNQILKKEKRKKREEKRKKILSTKQEKQKKGKTNLMDDAKLSKLLLKHRESTQNSICKKWYEN